MYAVLHLRERWTHFGDAHIHTSYSRDANWRMGTNGTTPADAYGFARGERITLPPFDAQGNSARAAQLQRPLAISVVTDHAENMGIVRVCSNPVSTEFGSWGCGRNQLLVEALRWLGNRLPGVEPLCGDGSQACESATGDEWRDTVKTTEDALDECEFTTSGGYEWSGTLEENSYPGNHGAQHVSGDGSKPQLPDRVEQNPGGLAVLYAEENTRESLFAAMRRREAYGTSGPRIGLRFFRGREHPQNICEMPDPVSQGYAHGVPMGDIIPAGVPSL